MALLAAGTAIVAAVVAALAIGVFVLVLVAPWKSVRREGPLDPDVEARLLLGEDPAAIAADEDQGR
jgi:hypothetical protein